MFEILECEDQRMPFIGARYRRRSMDVMTGQPGDYVYYTVTGIYSQFGKGCVSVVSDLNGREYKPFMDIFRKEYEAVDNVVTLHR